MAIAAVIDDPEAPGRGPSRLDMTYRWTRVGDLPVIGKFVGVALGVRKGADTLFVELRDHSHIAIRYEDLVSAVQAKKCPRCSKTTLMRDGIDLWTCDDCGHSLVQGKDEGPRGRSSWPRPR